VANVTRKIGLSLGADICWPICYEQIMERLDLAIPIRGDVVSFEVERVTIEPFELQQPCRYDLVIDRLTHWYFPSREWIKKAVLLDDLYVFNNPWSVQSMEKHTTYCAMMRLGFPIPETWLIPPKEYESKPDLRPTLERYAKLFDLSAIGETLSYPLYMKPYDGGGWVGVSRIENANVLRAAYEQSGRNVMHLQKAVEPYDLFVRCIGLGPQVRLVLYDPSAPLHDRYTTEQDFLPDGDASLLEDTILTINTFFGWDFNSAEVLRGEGGVWHPIDFANPCPDSQVTSLHYHFPWLIMANIRWSAFCAATKRAMRRSLDWDSFFEIAAREGSYREKLASYGELARGLLESERFEEFCEEHLSHLEEVTWEFFGSSEAKEAVRKKVQALYPASEVEQFTELFWGRIQNWRQHHAAESRTKRATAGTKRALASVSQASLDAALAGSKRRASKRKRGS
jgi:hypothetical protein